jgi:DNA polymerase-3 subunit gamma/tau
MSLALYRTYRPGRLSEVIGQDHVAEPLSRALDEGRIHHAYLLSGPRGCGKTSTARILARSMLCENGPTSDLCGTCEFCEALAPNGPGLVDVIELDAASHGGVDDTRDLRERAVFVPARARYKIYIIDEAHMVSKDGFNALLKLIEEPPEHVKFIFATTEVDKVLPTIRSRTFNYAFRLVPARQLQENLAGICEREGVPAEPAALALIARASGGSVRDAQSIMGQLIAGAGPEGLTQTVVADQLGVTDDALLDAAVTAIAGHDGPGLFAAVEAVVESGHDVRRFVTDLLHRFRDLLVLRHAGDSASAEVLDMSVDQREGLADQAASFGPTELTRFAEIINDGLTQLKGSTSPRLQLEILAARLLVPATQVDAESTLSRIDVLERRLSVLANAPSPTVEAVVRETPAAKPTEKASSEPAAAAPAPKPAQPSPPRQPAASAATAARTAPPPKPRLASGSQQQTPATPPAEPPQEEATPVASTTAAPAAADLESVLAVWPELLQQIQSRSRVAAAVWDGAQPVAVADGELRVEVPTAGQLLSITQSGRDVMLRTVLVESFGIDVAVKPVERTTAAEPEAEPSDSDPDLADSDLAGVDLLKEKLGATAIGEIEGN